jgi:hypothetical protein
MIEGIFKSMSYERLRTVEAVAGSASAAADPSGNPEAVVSSGATLPDPGLFSAGMNVAGTSYPRNLMPGHASCEIIEQMTAQACGLLDRETLSVSDEMLMIGAAAILQALADRLRLRITTGTHGPDDEPGDKVAGPATRRVTGQAKPPQSKKDQ